MTELTVHVNIKPIAVPDREPQDTPAHVNIKNNVPFADTLQASIGRGVVDLAEYACAVQVVELVQVGEVVGFVTEGDLGGLVGGVGLAVTAVNGED